MLTQQAVIQTVNQFSIELLKTGLNLRKVLLFGSFAKNCPHEHSDIDLCLVADEFTGAGFVDFERFRLVMRNKEFHRIQYKTYSTEDYLEGDPFIDYEINRTGIVLFDNLTEQPALA